MSLPAIPDPLSLATANGKLLDELNAIPDDVALPEAAPPECKWPVVSIDSAAAVVDVVLSRRERIERIKATAEAMVKHEEAQIRRLQFAVGGYVRNLGHKVVESWGTLETWTKSQLKGKAKNLDVFSGRLQFRAVAAAVRVPPEKEEAFVAWCQRSGNTHLYRLEYSVRMEPLKEYMELARAGKREIPTDENGVTLVESYEAGRYDTFSINGGK